MDTHCSFIFLCFQSVICLPLWFSNSLIVDCTNSDTENMKFTKANIQITSLPEIFYCH